MADNKSKKKKKRSEWLNLFAPRTIVATAALCVSLCSMLMTYLQMRSNQKAQEASVLPYVSCGVMHGNMLYDKKEAEYKMTISNDGVGPAFLEAVRIRCGDKIFDGNDFHNAIEWLVTDGDTSQHIADEYTYSSIMKRRLLPAGSNIEWFTQHSRPDAYRFLTKKWSKEGANNFIISICFSDVYGNKWTFEDLDYEIHPCKECPDWTPTE
jgi:hypothetical protein